MNALYILVYIMPYEIVILIIFLRKSIIIYDWKSLFYRLNNIASSMLHISNLGF